MNEKRYTVITGATGGIGSELARMLCADGEPIILACRSICKANELHCTLLEQFPEAKIYVEKLDLSSLTSVREFAARVESLDIKIKALVNNAAVIAPCFSTTEDGWEQNVGVNYVGVWELTRLFAPLIDKGGVVVNMVSLTASFSNIDIDFLCHARMGFPIEKFKRLKQYGRSKLALLLSTKEMSVRYSHLRFAAVDPGIVSTSMISMNRWYDTLADIFFRPFLKTPQKGVLPLYRALNDDSYSRAVVYLYKGKCFKRPLPKDIERSPMVAKLWDQTTILLQNSIR